MKGLLILTSDKKINRRLLKPEHNHTREYWVQVDGAMTQEALKRLQQGIDITANGKSYRTKKCKAYLFENDPPVFERNPPIRLRKNIPANWIKIMLTEGRNRQVRKMTAAVGFPTLRLIRYRIEKCTVDGLLPGEMRILSKQEAYQLLFPGRNEPRK